MVPNETEYNFLRDSVINISKNGRLESQNLRNRESWGSEFSCQILCFKFVRRPIFDANPETFLWAYFESGNRFWAYFESGNPVPTGEVAAMHLWTLPNVKICFTRHVAQARSHVLENGGRQSSFISRQWPRIRYF